MAKEHRTPRLGIVFDYNSNWMGGTYYILNLLHAIAELPSVEQPRVIIYGENEAGFNTVKNEVKLKDVSYKKITNVFNNKLIVGVNFISRSIAGFNLFNKGPRNKNEVIFPNASGAFFKNVPNRIYWIPDFQEKYYPVFFSAEDLAFREAFNIQMIAQKFPVVFSSEDVKKDFKKFYPASPNPIYTLPFAVSIQDYSTINFQNIQEQYELNHPYFITPNQFWIHKNHKVIIEATAILRDKGIKFKVLFSGKDYDPRCPEYTDQLKEQICHYGLEETVIFLGFLERKLLLQLIKNSVAVVQPSLFEGWSTVVEDAKALNKPVIASSLAVHKEQMGEKGHYFDPNNATALADAMIEQLKSGVTYCDWNYIERKKEFARGFVSMLHEVVQ